MIIYIVISDVTFSRKTGSTRAIITLLSHRFLEWESVSDCAFSRSLPACTFLNATNAKMSQYDF